MARIQPFRVEQWMDQYETTPDVLNVAETCASSVSLDELQDLSENDLKTPLIDTSRPLTYGAIPGSEALRKSVSRTHIGVGSNADDVVITQGAISANFLVFYALVGKGDHVVCVYPTYQQLYTVPESLGAEVSLWRLKPEHEFIPAVEELAELVRPNTKMIVINNPNNPTGAQIPTETLRNIVDFAKSRGIIVFSDEVYRPIFHDFGVGGTSVPPSVASLGYEKTIVTGSMSKAYALAGIRIGWVASKDASILEAILSARDYTAISVSQLDDQVAQYALSERVFSRLLQRNLALTRENLALLKVFVESYPSICSWVQPNSGTMAFIRFTSGGQSTEPVDDVKFCLDVLSKTNVMLVPGSRCFGEDRDFVGYVRIGYACSTPILAEALQRLGSYLEQNML